MKLKKFLVIISFLIIPIFSYSQNEEIENLKRLLKEVTIELENTTDQLETLTIYTKEIETENIQLNIELNNIKILLNQAKTELENSNLTIEELKNRIERDQEETVILRKDLEKLSAITKVNKHFRIGIGVTSPLGGSIYGSYDIPIFSLSIYTGILIISSNNNINFYPTVGLSYRF